MTTRRLAPLILIASLVLLSACRDRKITSYQAPKEIPRALPPAASDQLPADHPPIGNTPAPGSDMANTAVPTANGAELTWTAPATWTPKALGPMRKGSFAIKGDGIEADLSITAFPGDTGGLAANLNRWRGQIGLPPLADAEVDAALAHFDANGLHFEVVDFAGTAGGTPTRIIGAILSRPGETWFFKLMGPDALVAGQKQPFVDFLRTVKEAK